MIAILSLILLLQPVPQAEEEIWYVWLDTPATVDGKEVRLVGESMFSITCCVKSGKFSRFEKSALKWAQKNYDPSLESGVLKKIQDRSLAQEVLDKAHAEAQSSDTIVLVDFTDECK